MLLSRILMPLDRLTLRLTREKYSLTTMLSGLPVIWLTTFGKITGQPRSCPLIPLPAGERLVLFATNFGSARHPSWYLNLQANPQVLVRLNGATGKFIAQNAEENDREIFWRQAVALYPGYDRYAASAGKRRIPIVLLTPEDPAKGDG